MGESRSRKHPLHSAVVALPQSKTSMPFTRLSIVAGNSIQISGLLMGCFALVLARLAHSAALALAAEAAGWVLLYFSCHAIAHWCAGRLLGIHFAFYTIAGTGNPEGYPVGVRWVFEHLPFLGVRTVKSSMAKASPTSKAIMWSSGVTSSAVVPTLGALLAYRPDASGSKAFLLFAVFWSIGTLSSNWRSRGGDFSKARRALHSALPHDPTIRG